MKPFLKYFNIISQTALLALVLLLLNGCENGNEDLEKAKQLSSSYKELEIEVNQLVSIFDKEANTTGYKSAENLMDNIRYTDGEIKGYIEDKDISEQRLDDWKEKLSEYKAEHNNLKTSTGGIAEKEPVKEENNDDDNDGVTDDNDECPNESGVKPHGCKDRDGDGVPDYRDDCPGKKGTKSNGCPKKKIEKPVVIPQPPVPKGGDDDLDDVPNSIDECPNNAGRPENKGCPDKDKDGFYDVVPKSGFNFDECKDVAGNVNGCPDDDADGYYNNDAGTKKDDCPDKKGIAPDGCPLECTPSKTISPLRFEKNCTKQIQTGTLVIKPNTQLLLQDFKVISSSNGNINYYIKSSSGETLNYRANRSVNKGTSQITTNKLMLRKGLSYELIVESIDDNLTLAADSCALSTHPSKDVMLSFKDTPFIHQINFCKK